MLGGIVRGARTALRIPVEADLPSFNRWSADLGLRKVAAAWQDPGLLVNWKERLAESAKAQREVLWSIDEGAGTLVGLCRIRLGWAEDAAVQHFLLDPRARGRGLGKDAALALHRYLFDYLHLRQAMCAIVADNAGALALARHLGYAEFGRGHQVHYRDGAYVDEVHLVMTLGAWDERWGAAQREYAPLGPELER